MQLSSTTLATESESATIIYSPAFCLRCQMFRARLQNLGDHILNTVSSINLSQMRFRSGRRKKSSEARIFFFLSLSQEETYLCTDRPVIP